ncbi:NADP-dependent phosphogluconate dehydrogenase, partial [Klebsiella variicola]|nr:NADP-dependent phosphogluconate dehydrogenase [Klebsiella variicola]
MQLFSEAYDMLRKACGLSNDEMSALFDKWNHEDLKCYLAEITAEVLKKDDDLTSDKVIDHILNEASYKGTGNWTLEDA